MGEAPTKRGHGPGDRRSLEDTIRADPADGARATTSMPPEDRYRLGAEFGRGGMHSPGPTQELPVGPMRWAVATSRGDRIAYLDGAGAAHVVAGAPIHQLVVPASNRPPLISAEVRLVVGQSINDQLVVVEPATRATWDLPVYYASTELMTIAPTARRSSSVALASSRCGRSRSRRPS